MSKIVAIAKAPGPEPDPARAALAQAIAAKAKADKTVEAAEQRESDAYGLVGAADDALAKAIAAVESAKNADASASSVAGVVTTAGIRKARSAVVDAEDALAVAQDVVVRAKAARAQAQHTQAHAQVQVLACRSAVVAPVVLELAARVEKSKHETFVALEMIYELLHVNESLMPELEGVEVVVADQKIEAPLADARAAARNARMENKTLPMTEAAADARNKIRTTLEKLLVDPTTVVDVGPE